jgi:hypothetical protein
MSGKRRRSLPTLLERISEVDLESLRHELACRLVEISVVFSLNRGYPYHYGSFSRSHKKRQLMSGIRPKVFSSPQHLSWEAWRARNDEPLRGDFLLGERLNH